MSEASQRRAAFAEWLGRQHLGFDKRLTSVVYLPNGGREDEVRLLEVNTGLFPDPESPIVPVETTPAINELPFRVWIADVTPQEWERIQANASLLPAGWSLDGKMIIQRKR